MKILLQVPLFLDSGKLRRWPELHRSRTTSERGPRVSDHPEAHPRQDLLAPQPRARLPCQVQGRPGIFSSAAGNFLGYTEIN